MRKWQDNTQNVPEKGRKKIVLRSGRVLKRPPQPFECFYEQINGPPQDESCKPVNHDFYKSRTMTKGRKVPESANNMGQKETKCFHFPQPTRFPSQNGNLFRNMDQGCFSNMRCIDESIQQRGLLNNKRPNVAVDISMGPQGQANKFKKPFSQKDETEIKNAILNSVKNKLDSLSFNDLETEKKNIKCRIDLEFEEPEDDPIFDRPLEENFYEKQKILNYLLRKREICEQKLSETEEEFWYTKRMIRESRNFRASNFEMTKLSHQLVFPIPRKGGSQDPSLQVLTGHQNVGFKRVNRGVENDQKPRISNRC